MPTPPQTAAPFCSALPLPSSMIQPPTPGHPQQVKCTDEFKDCQKKKSCAPFFTCLTENAMSCSDSKTLGTWLDSCVPHVSGPGGACDGISKGFDTWKPALVSAACLTDGLCGNDDLTSNLSNIFSTDDPQCFIKEKRKTLTIILAGVALFLAALLGFGLHSLFVKSPPVV